MVKTKTVKPEEEKVRVFSSITGEEITYQMVNIAISLFEPFLPQEFIRGRGAYAKRPTRAAVENLLKTISIVELNTMIQQYFVLKRDDEFRPSVGTVYEFCTYKYSKIQDFLSRGSKARHSLNNIPGEVRGTFNEKHKATLDRLAAEKERVNREFKEQMGK